MIIIYSTENTLPIMVGSGNELLKTGFLPIMKKVSDLVQKARVIEEQVSICVV